MYRVLLVDDEKIILNGISRIVNWEACGTELAGTARNGLEAFDFIGQSAPDIVISDIRMPGMDGLELAAKIRERHPEIKIILLSGFSEFDYAKAAMQYGVRHYLLKPCNENQIEEALREVVEELRQTEGREQFIQNLKYGLEKVMPHVKEQFLKEFVTNKTYGSRDWEYYCKLFDLKVDGRKVRLALFQLEGSFEFEHLFAVKNIAEEILERPLLSSTVGEHVLILLEDEGPSSDLLQRLSKVRDTFRQYYKIDLTIALSEPGEMSRTRRLYKQTLECLNHRFYLGEGSLITARDIEIADTGVPKELIFDEEQLLLAVKSGHWEDAEAELDRFFRQLAELRLDMHTAKSYVIQTYTAVIRLSGQENINRYMAELVPLLGLDTLQGIQQLFKGVAKEISLRFYEQNRTKHSAIIDKVLDIIGEHLGNPELSLNWVAHKMLYMNADYLGKLFKKETGEKFSNYVIKMRVAKAAERIARQDDIRIFELAEQLGFGDNPQYFSQVFKKYVGCTPSEYMKSPSQLGFLNKDDGFLD
ncbi:response regulator transcription factor [Gorillibacterium sp. sgz5001074]|uniref:response regulator transcription factor n=1 Tax=Gorillibacterium sp. sgz5001074 TaxID=3446695 RepID=UPI003F67B40D